MDRLELLPLGATLLSALPALAVDVALLAVAIARWNRHPRVAMYAATSGGLLLMLDSIGRLAMTWLPMRAMGSGQSVADTGTSLMLVGGVMSLVHALAMGLVVVAIFIDRDARAP